MTIPELIASGFAPIAGPYRPSEYGMLEAAKKQLGRIPWAGAAENLEEPTHLTLFRAGVKKVEAEEVQ